MRWLYNQPELRINQVARRAYSKSVLRREDHAFGSEITLLSGDLPFKPFRIGAEKSP